MRLVRIFLIIPFLVCILSVAYGQKDFNKIQTISIKPERGIAFYDSARINMDNGKITSVVMKSVTFDGPQVMEYIYGDDGLLKSLEKPTMGYDLKYDDQGRLTRLIEKNYANGKITNHYYTHSQDSIFEVCTGALIPYNKSFIIKNGEVVSIFTRQTGTMPELMKSVLEFKMSYQKSNLTKIEKIKTRQSQRVSEDEYTLEFVYDKGRSVFAAINEGLFGKHASTTSLLVNSTSFYNNLWEPYFIGFDMATNNIVSMTSTSDSFSPYTVKYEYHKSGALRKIVKENVKDGKVVKENIMFNYKGTN